MSALIDTGYPTRQVPCTTFSSSSVSFVHKSFISFRLSIPKYLSRHYWPWLGSGRSGWSHLFAGADKFHRSWGGTGFFSQTAPAAANILPAVLSHFLALLLGFQSWRPRPWLRSSIANHSRPSTSSVSSSSWSSSSSHAG